MKTKLTCLGISFLFVFLIGCANQSNSVLETAVTTQPATDTPTATLSPTQTSKPISTPTASPTLTPLPTTTSVPTNTPTPLPNVPETIYEMEDWLTTHWQEKTDPALVKQSLWRKRWIPLYPYSNQLPMGDDNIDASGLITIDLDGNGTEEWIVTLLFCNEEGKPSSDENDCGWDGNQHGSLWIINENGLIYQSAGSIENIDRATYPIIQVDLTGDGLGDLVTWADFCNISCYPDYHVISAHFGEIENIIYGTQDNAIHGMGTQIFIEDESGDGIDDIILRGFVYYSAGAEPQRGRTEVWSWNGNAISLYERRDHRISFLVHALYYANEKYEEHDTMMAQSWYARAIFDDNLNEYRSNGEERAMVQQYAAFRLALLHLRRNGEDDAKQWQTWLEDNFPDKPLTKGVALLISEWEAHDNLSLACEVVTSFLQKEEIRFQESGACPEYNSTCGLFTPIEVIDTYGVNPELHVEDICKVNYP